MHQTLPRAGPTRPYPKLGPQDPIQSWARYILSQSTCNPSHCPTPVAPLLAPLHPHVADCSLPHSSTPSVDLRCDPRLPSAHRHCLDRYKNLTLDQPEFQRRWGSVLRARVLPLEYSLACPRAQARIAHNAKSNDYAHARTLVQREAAAPHHILGASQHMLGAPITCCAHPITCCQAPLTPTPPHLH